MILAVAFLLLMLVSMSASFESELFFPVEEDLSLTMPFRCEDEGESYGFYRIYPSRTSGFLLAVGTNACFEDYKAVAEAIIETTPTLYVVIIDPKPGNLEKLDPVLYVDCVKRVLNELEKRSFAIQHWYIGGHSASAYAAIEVLKAYEPNKLPFTPKAYIGFDPVGVSISADAVLRISSLVFTTTTSGGCTLWNARGGDYYRIADRTLKTCNRYYLVEIKDGGHCSFSNGNCRFVDKTHVCHGTGDQTLFNDILAKKISSFVNDKPIIKEGENVLIRSKSSEGCRTVQKEL